jgi:hypothetical protein
VYNDSIQPAATAKGELRWRKSSYSSIGECVAVAECGEQVAVRNSNHPGAGTIFFSRAEMSAWIAGCKAGEFDDMAD